jgi:hypothetical protein
MMQSVRRQPFAQAATKARRVVTRRSKLAERALLLLAAANLFALSSALSFYWLAHHASVSAR